VGIVDTVFEELVRDKFFIKTCNFLRSHAVRHDQQTKDKVTRQVNTTSQPTAPPFPAKRIRANMF
jgi:hypothetical protein